MIPVAGVTYRALFQHSRSGGLGWGGGVGLVVGAGVGQECGEGGGGGVGDGDPDGDLVFVFAVEALDVEGGQQSFLQRFGCLGQDVGQVGQFVQERGVVVGLGGGLEGG
jgi:hypothetical protein